MLQSVSIGINLLGLMSTSWMGVYLVTRYSRRPEMWLSALASWSLGGYFLNQLLALISPPAPSMEIRLWLYHLMVFWPRDVFELGWKGWLLGWLPAYSIFFWYHATLYMLPGQFTRKRLLGASLGYAVALASILIKARYQDAWINLIEDPLYNPPLVFPFFALSAIGSVTFAGLSIFNLYRTTRSSLARIPLGLIRLFIYSAVSVGAAGSLGFLSDVLKTRIPQALTASFLLIALALAMIGVARYNLPFHFDSGKLPYLTGGKENNEASIKGLEKLENTEDFSMRDVELALRNLYNYPYLADSPLSKLRLVVQCHESLEKGSDTYIDRGRAVSKVVSDAVSMLRPSNDSMPNPPPRTWYPYIVLWDAYVENKPNLEIMSRLYVSEGTFNRTRKAAIGSVTRILMDIESHTK